MKKTKKKNNNNTKKKKKRRVVLKQRVRCRYRDGHGVEKNMQKAYEVLQLTLGGPLYLTHLIEIISQLAPVGKPVYKIEKRRSVVPLKRLNPLKRQT